MFCGAWLKVHKWPKTHGSWLLVHDQENRSGAPQAWAPPAHVDLCALEVTKVLLFVMFLAQVGQCALEATKSLFIVFPTLSSQVGLCALEVTSV